jgi:hypothetical protein
MPSASIVDDHEIRELTISPSRADRQRSGPGLCYRHSPDRASPPVHFIQHLAYVYSLDAVVSPESFLQGVTVARRYAGLSR